MYSEGNRRTAARRTNDEFLRRMLGGELVGSQAVMNASPSMRSPLPDRGGKTACDGSPRMDSGNHMPGKPCGYCPKEIPAPALSMVYAPRQCWQNLFSPEEGLAHGSIFAELVLPLESVPKNCGTGVGACK